jgi:hypothetical protein
MQYLPPVCCMETKKCSVMKELVFYEKINVKLSDEPAIVQDVKLLHNKKVKKTYKVTVIYTMVPEQEAKLKRATVESLIKRTNRK